MNGMIAWFAKNSVVANLLLVLILAAGLLAVGDLKQEVYADFALDIVTVRADYRGAGPEDVEEGICIRLEEAVQGIEGIKKITTTATEGRGSMVLEIHTGYDARTLMEDVKARVDAIDTFPEEVELPIVEQAMRRFQVINIAIAGQTDLETLKRLGERVRDELTALPDISEAELRNAPPYEISIEVSEGAMRRWHLTFDEVANAVRRFSVDLPGGSIKTDVGEVLLRTNGQAYSGEEYERLPLLILPDGTNIELSDVATVVDGFEEVARSAMLDGKPAVVVEVYRVGDQSVISVSEAVRNYVASESPKLPDGIEMITWRDNARQLKSRVGLLVENGLTGLLLVFVVLALFLRPRLAFWVTLGIPVTFLGAIALMPLHGTSLNMVTVYSFILVLGIVVDDAIVVGENIHATQLRTGKGTSGAIKGTQQVLVPVTFGVLTTMAAFAPMLFVPGVLGKMIVGVSPDHSPDAFLFASRVEPHTALSPLPLQEAEGTRELERHCAQLECHPRFVLERSLLAHATRLQTRSRPCLGVAIRHGCRCPVLRPADRGNDGGWSHSAHIRSVSGLRGRGGAAHDAPRCPRRSDSCESGPDRAECIGTAPGAHSRARPGSVSAHAQFRRRASLPGVAKPRHGDGGRVPR